MKRAHFLLIPLLLTIVCCNGVEIKTITLTPITFETETRRIMGNATWSCWPFICYEFDDMFDHDCTPGPFNPGSVYVGYYYYYDNGTEPCNCWWYTDCVYRGSVIFDLSSLQNKGIVLANLKYTDAGPCPRVHFYVPTSSNWPSTWERPPYPIPKGSSGPGVIDVTSTVRDWVLGNLPNFGFMLVGQDESFANWLWDTTSAEIGSGLEGIHRCISSVGGFVLEVKYTD